MCLQLCFVELGGAKDSLALTPNRQFWRLLRVSALPTGRRETSCYLLQRCWLQLGQISWPFWCELCGRHQMDVPLPNHQKRGFGAQASIPLAAYNVACRVATAVLCPKMFRCPKIERADEVTFHYEKWKTMYDNGTSLYVNWCDEVNETTNCLNLSNDTKFSNLAQIEPWFPCYV